MADLMNRREALIKLGLIAGGTIVGSQVLLMGCKPGKQDLSNTFNTESLKLLNEFGETVIPATESGGAKAANVAAFMKTIVTDFYTDEEQKIFAEGIQELDKRSGKAYGKSFIELRPDQRHELLLELEKELSGAENEKHFYIMMKQLTIWGYLTSEVAANEVFDHVPVPGYFDGCVAYNSEVNKAMFPRTSQWDALRFARLQID